MDEKRPQLNHTELQQLRWLLGGVLSLFTAVSVLLLEVEAWWIVLLTMMAAAAGIIRPDIPGRLPRWIHPAAFPVIGSVFLFDLWSNGQILPALVRLDLMLILYRCITYRARRDDLQLVLLGLFLIIVAGVITVSLAFSLQIVLFTAFSLALLFVLTLGETPEKVGVQVGLDGSDSRVPVWARELRWRVLMRRVWTMIDGRLAGVLAILFAGVVGLSAVLFLSIPRFQLENSLFLERLMSKKARTGFTENVKFGDVTDIAQDNSLALTVDVPDPARMPIVPFWRMLVLDEYMDSGGFRLSARARREAFGSERLTIQLPGAKRGEGRENPEQWTFYFEAGLSRYMPLPGGFSRIRFREVQNVQYSRRMEVLSLRNEPASMTAYRLDEPSMERLLPDPDFARWLGATPRDESGRVRRSARLLLELPQDPTVQARLSRKVSEILGASGGKVAASEFSRKACVWLSRHHAYSLVIRIPGIGGDPLVRWLDSTAPGHCELFAGSFVLLARAAGFPTRMVIGFKGGSINAFSNSITVRNSDAHAWCEIWDSEEGAWRRVDPTPGGEDVDATNLQQASVGNQRIWDDSWGARFESLRVFWYRRVVNFDQRSQVEAMQKLKKAAQEGGQALRVIWADKLAKIAAWLRQPWDIKRFLTLMEISAVAACAAWFVWRFRTDWRWRGFASKTENAADPVRREAGRWLGRLTAQGVTDDEEGRALHAELLRLRYGASRTWSPPAAVFRRARRWRPPKSVAIHER